ncbi:complement C1q-like protein 4 [Nelusetta ayraudi]|uniref:complement C1q-like protein 4 n=1 Tax=Nelusetta ayraudi TaxID=303726 RepID=UPI003F720687
MVAKVCFTAVASKGGVYGPFDDDITLEFETAVTSNKAYDPTSGLFTAPTSGSYLFSFFYQAPKNKPSGLCLVKNQQVIVKTCDKNIQGSTHTDNGGNVAILHLRAGDTVCVRLLAKCHVTATNRVTSFSGFLIAED